MQIAISKHWVLTAIPASANLNEMTAVFWEHVLYELYMNFIWPGVGIANKTSMLE